jgi:hypothetical protein
VSTPIDLAHFVLDQNFPFHVLSVRWPLHVRLTPLGDIAPNLVEDHEDWEILYHLDQRGDVHGFVTNDANMLDLPREITMLQWTKLTLVVTASVGHDAIRATGLLMVYMDAIARRGVGQPQLYVLKPINLAATNLHDHTNKLAGRVGLTPPELLQREREAIRAHLDGRL